MKPFQINVVNALILIVMGLWAYLTAVEPSGTALIAPGFGLLFLILTPPFRKENKVVAHIIVLLTFLLFIALYMPLQSRLEANDTIGLARVAIMMLSCAVAMIIYIKSFRDARKAREAAGE